MARPLPLTQLGFSILRYEGILAMSAISFPQHDHVQEAFNAEERQLLLDEDSAAFSGVTGILIAVIAAGVILAALSVALILAMA
jgi:hypothetical protein